jgi:hypothetical protein
LIFIKTGIIELKEKIMGAFIWLSIRDTVLIIAGVLMILFDHPGWAALFLLFYLMILLQSFRQQHGEKK